MTATPEALSSAPGETRLLLAETNMPTQIGIKMHARGHHKILHEGMKLLTTKITVMRIRAGAKVNFTK
jgi:hypothetical protein